MRGIIIPGGGRYLLSALVNIRILRDHGCQLPIELWHFKDERLSRFARKDLEHWNVKTVSLPDLPIRYSSKPYAIAHSEFSEILCLDADNTPLRNPEYLFESQEYRETGAIFWPDFLRAPANSAWEALAKCPPKTTYQQESGQLLINRNLHKKALSKTLEFNKNYHLISPHLWGAKGDKDTFQLGWYATKSDFHMIPTFPGSCGIVRDGTYYSQTMVQHDTQGSPLFLHKTLNKWHPLRSPGISWETMMFAREATGSKVSVDIHYTTHPSRTVFSPESETYSIPATDHIGDLEHRCNAHNSRIRKKPWYLMTIFPMMSAEQFRKIFRKFFQNFGK